MFRAIAIATMGLLASPVMADCRQTDAEHLLDTFRAEDIEHAGFFCPCADAADEQFVTPHGPAVEVTCFSEEAKGRLVYTVVWTKAGVVVIPPTSSATD